MNYKNLLIKEYTHWELYVHENQYFLGRTYIWSKRNDLVDLMDTALEEREELFVIGGEIKRVLANLWAPDLFNWVSLGNLTAHCHLHVIPRYAAVREFAGVEFKDERWGKNYAPYNYDFKVPENTLATIKTAILTALPK